MKVELLDYTGHGMTDPAAFAASLLIFAKNTRVKMEPDGFEAIEGWPAARRQEELAYIANTIPGSWEMVRYVFLMTDVTRAFTHQLVRTRTASYAQQTMQILDVSGFSYRTGPHIEADAKARDLYTSAMAGIDGTYRLLLHAGVPVEEARGVLPTDIHTNIIMAANLRTVVEFCRARVGPRNAGETSEVARAMVDAVLAAHPWAALFLRSDADDAAAKLDEYISSTVEDRGTANHMHKLVDRMRRR